MKTAVIYPRVSTLKQLNNGNSLESQKKACINYCKTNNIKILGVYKEAFTGKETKRPIFDKAIDFAKKNSANYFIIYDIDRFSREGYDAYSKIKTKLKNYGIKLKDCKNIIGDEKVVITNNTVDMSQYSWNMENPTEMSEMVYSAQAKIEGNKILQRTITKEIELEQMGYNVRASNYGYKNKKELTNFGKAMIQVEDLIEGKWVIEMFKERAKGILSDIEIVEQLNLKGCKKRSGKEMDVKYMQELIKKPVYAGFICSKWTGYNIIKTPYEGLVNLNIWNKANKGKKIIIEHSNGKISISHGKKEEENSLIKTRRKKFDKRLPFRNLVNSSILKGKPISGGFSKGKGGLYGYYYPIRKKGIKGENIKKEIFENNIYDLFNDIKVSDVLKTIFEDRFNIIFEENKKDLLKSKKELEENLKVIKQQKEELENNIENVLQLPKVLKSINKKLEDIETKEQNIIIELDSLKDNEKLENTKFKEFAFYLIEHMGEILKESQNFEELETIFKFAFQETPTYNQIIKRTPKLYPLFALQSQQKNPQTGDLVENLKWQHGKV